MSFVSAQSSHAVCEFCQSVVVRQAQTLARVGKVAEEFADYSPLRLGQRGQWKGRDFTLVGRLQLGVENARWTEWQAAFADGSGHAFLSEDNGAFVMSERQVPGRELPPANTWKLGAAVKFRSKPYTVTLVRQVRVVAAQGELAHLPPIDAAFTLVELRSSDGQLLSFEYGDNRAEVWSGLPVDLASLGMEGLSSASEEREEARHFNCPACGGRVDVKLAETRSISCSSCGTLIDVSNGVGAEVVAAKASQHVTPAIALGKTGTLFDKPWQVVGFQRKQGEDDEDTFEWDEYLLYNHGGGFAFLVKDESGWRFSEVLTGAPDIKRGRKPMASYQGKHYFLAESYSSSTRYVEGEFFWQVKTGEQTRHRDFRGAAGVADQLCEETTTGEVVWSRSSPVPANVVLAAFGLPLERLPAYSPKSGMGNWIVFGLIALLLIVSLSLLSHADQCDPAVEDCRSTQGRSYSGGGLGRASGGWHK
ncbi:DUF4178 domain-containing protein [Hydrogenophaga sp. 5NK40-0174]|uniref:DUF4178 domain-containing protein n=1 Tax=Hydrogenophaga sp. 5NK40-0174 TaxID=3127649 RepID=UPI00310AD48B